PVFTQTITGFVNGEDAGSAGVAGSALGSTSASATSGVGSYAIAGSTGTLSAANYDFAAANGTLTINKAHLTVTADNQSRLYGQTNPVFTQTITGFVNGEDAGSAGVAGSALGSTSASPSTGVGSYAIAGSTGTLSAANYDFAASNGTLTINKAHLTVTADSQSRLYGQTNPALTQTITGFVNGEDAGSAGVSGSAAGSASASVTSGVGSYAIAGSTGTLSAANYDFAAANGTLTINKAHLTVTADNQTRPYGQVNPALTQVITGFVNGEDAASAGVTGTAAGSTAAAMGTGVGGYAIVGSTGTLSAANYDFAASNGTLTINKAHLTVTADNQSRLYGQANPVFTQQVSGFVNGENAISAGLTGMALGSSGATQASGVGSYVIQGSAGTLNAANYDFAAANGTLTIGKAHLTVTPDAQARLYGQANPVFTQQVSGFVNGENATSAGLTGMALGSSGATQASGVGSYVIQGSAGTLNAANYDFAAANGTLTVDKAHLTVTPDAQARLYGQANPVFTQQVSGFVNGENATSAGFTGMALGSSGATQASGVGSYAIAGSTGTLSAANYDFAASNGTLTINKAHLAVTADNQARLYGQANPTLTQTITGFVNGEDAGSAGVAGSALGSTSASPSTGVGSYVIQGSTGTLTAANYDFAAANGTLTINKAHLTVTADKQARLYGQANPALTQTATSSRAAPAR
ncbi:MAG: MBG-2 domain-containing protein, partial [Burkholderiales bacterium]|nr:MBG-2 domain-containing protein [Burkholderiales bacterium]